MHRGKPLGGSWDDFPSNTREELVQKMNDFELPHFPGMTKDQLMLILENHIKRGTDPELAKKVHNIYTKERHTKRRNISKEIMRYTIFFLLCVIFLFLFHVWRAPPPYCTAKNSLVNCIPCPDNAVCSKHRATCPKHYYLSKVGCRQKSQRKAIKHALCAAAYISDRDGDCIDPKPFLTIDEFEYIFPKANLTFILSDDVFGIQRVNDTLRSKTPVPSPVCTLLSAIDRHENEVGFGVLFLLVCTFVKIMSVRAERQKKLAMEIAKQTHKVLATTDRELYIYDIKVQMRAHYPNIDKLWKYVVKYVEEDSHVVVGVFGARHQVYWKWIHN